MKKFLFILSALLFSVLSFAQTATVKGKLFNMEDGVKTEVPMTKVMALESGALTKSDFFGVFTLELPVGKNTIEVSPALLKKETIVIDVVAGKVNEIEIELFSSTLTTVTVTAKSTSNGGTEITTAKATKEDTKVVTTQTSTQIEQKGASNVGDGSKTMTGMSTVGDVLYVRGLGDRYNVAYLNGLPLPSPNPDFRVAPLNIFPTSVVSSVSVSKVMSSELYGDFSGGAFNIVTKSYLEKPTLKFSLGFGGNSQTVFGDFKTYQGGKTDYFGIDDGTRGVPQFVIDNSKPLAYSAVNNIYPNSFYNSVEGKTTGFADNFGTQLTKALPNTSFSVMGGNFKSFTKSESKSSGLGYVVLLDHGQSYKQANGAIKLINAQSEERLNYDMTKYTKSTSTTGLFSTYLRINPDHNIVFNALVVNTSDDEVRDTWGKHFDYAKNVYSNRITYKQNYMSVNQLIGTHKFLKPKKEDNFARLILDWRGSYNLTGSEEPDRRQVVLFYDDKEDEEHYSFNYIDKNENHRFYSELNEREVATKVNLKFVAAYDSIGNNKVDERIVFNIGSDFKSKTRNFDYKQYNYILNSMASELGSNVNINGLSNYLDTEHHDAGGFFIQEIPNGASSYVAKSSVIAQYADAKFKFNKLEIIPGVRFEISEQSVLNRNQQSPSILEKTVNSAADVLPSLIAKYSLSEKNVLRLVGSKTVTRPRFNELAPFQYTLFFAGMKAEGNPELQNSSNYNVDFRYEHYPRPGEMITIGGFYKRIDNPIEQVMKATASGQLMSYANALSANVAGAELEFVRKLSFIYGNDEAKRDSSILNNFAFGMNATYMFTSVQIDTTDLSTINTNSARPLEGASPFLLNLSLRYEHKFENKTKMMLATSYNIFGKRLVNVGSNGIGDSYALPVNSLNLVSKFSFDNNLTVGFKVNNVLNPSIDIVQEDMQNIGETINVSSLKTGIDFSFSLGYTINYNKNKKSK